MQVTEKTLHTDTPEKSGKFEGMNSSKAVADQFASYLTKESVPDNTSSADTHANTSANRDEHQGQPGFPDNYTDVVENRELRRRGDPYMDPLETGYLLDIRGPAQFDAVMQRHEPLIVNEAQKYDLDPRALAGAMKWEHEENPRGWISDAFQIGPLGKLKEDPGIGFGSMHNNVVQKFFPEWDTETSAKARLYMDTAVPLMAAQMDAQATRFESGINAFLKSEGIDAQVSVRDNPVMLSWLYNTSEASVDRSISKQISLLEKQIAEDEPLSLHLNIYANKLGKSQIGMAPWIEKNLGDFVSYKASQIDKNEPSIPLRFENN